MVYETPINNGIEFDTIYGKYEITEPLLLELINQPIFRRLQAMPQAGPSHFVVPFIIYRGKRGNLYTRFDHS